MGILISKYKRAVAAGCVGSFLIGATASGSTGVLVYSGTFDGDHPAPAMIGKVRRGDRYQIDVRQASALVNYPNRETEVVSERVETIETGGVVTCPYFVKIDGSPKGTRVNASHAATINHKVVCDDGSCTDLVGVPIPKEKLLFGKYDLPKIQTTDGKDFGFLDTRWDFTQVSCPPGAVCGLNIDTYPIACQEFSVERTFSELHYFDRLLILENFREQELLDLDVDFRKFYVTFENERHDTVTCSIPDLLLGGDVIQVGDIRDCVLPAGNQFTMAVQSRFFLKDTRPCGKFVTKGVKTPNGYVPDWYMGWYECDGQADRAPIEKQYAYATRVELGFTKMSMGGN